MKRFLRPKANLALAPAVLLFIYPKILNAQQPDPGAAVTTFNTMVLSLTTLADNTTPNTTIAERYNTGKSAIQHISNAIANVNQVLLFAETSNQLGLGSNPWSDEGFRNTWDDVESIFGVVGTGLAAVAQFVDIGLGDSENVGSGIGLSIFAASKLVGSVFGAQNGSQFEESVRFVEFTRSAYDDLRGVSTVVTSYRAENEALLATIYDYISKYDDAEDDPARVEKLVGAQSFVTQFDLVMAQLPALVSHYKRVVESYCPGAVTHASTNRGTIGDLACAPRPSGGGGAGFSLEGDTKSHILNAAVAIASLEQIAEAADKVRVLSPRLRQAITAPVQEPQR